MTISKSNPRFERRFYLGVSLLFMALVFWTFARTFYLKAFFATSVLSPLLHIHSVVMSGWVVLLVVQSSLIAAHRVQWHRRLGVFGVGWAVLVVILGSVTTVHAAARESTRPYCTGRGVRDRHGSGPAADGGLCRSRRCGDLVAAA